MTRMELAWPLLLALWAEAVGPGVGVAQPLPHSGESGVALGLEEFAIPDVPVLTQDGLEVRFYTDLVAGKVVAINFIFTTCTTICPPMGAVFGRLRQELDEAGRGEVQLLSVSIDPTTDTPQRLKAWRERFGGASGWTLVTGAKPDIDRLLKALEIYTADFMDHAPVVLVGNEPVGRWERTYGLTPPGKLVELLLED